MGKIGNITTQEEIEMKAGIGMNTTAVTGFTPARMSASALNAESILNAATRFNYVDGVTSGAITGSAFTGILSNIVSSLTAIDAVKWDFSNYQNRIIAEDTINILRDSALRDISILRDIKTQEWIGSK